jgi:hypothetical protein
MGVQDHTTSSFAMCRNVDQHTSVHRIPLRVRDDAYVPLLDAGCRAIYGN